MTRPRPCRYCARMAALRLPGHAAELATLARRDATMFGLSVMSVIAAVTDRFAAVPDDHPGIGTEWGQRVFVRRVVADLMGPAAFRAALDRLNTNPPGVTS